MLVPSRIHVLDPTIVNLIAAGEVIDSWAAVVRELVENALDAGATRITISLWPQLWRVQVADNGNGMSPADLACCAQAHSTSKIRDRQDLVAVTTLGFRGEALHSLTQLAEVEILSRSQPGTDTVGARVYFSQGQVQTIEEAAIAPGTIVTVAQLFANWPTRRESLPPLNQQLKALQQIVVNLALCHPHVTWQVWQHERPWFAISPSPNAQGILPQVLRSVRSSDLQFLAVALASPTADASNSLRQHQSEVESQDAETVSTEIPEKASTKSEDIQTESSQLRLSTSEARLELVLGLPDRCHRHRPDWIRIAINGRCVRSPELEQTIMAAMFKTLPRDRFPVCFLHLHLKPNYIDWNRHPAKTEIYLHSLEYWQAQISQAITQALRLGSQVLRQADANQRVGKLLKVAESEGTYRVRSQQDSSPASTASEQPDEIGFMTLTAIAQASQTYIVAEHPSGIWLVEQHIAHERILYEQLLDNWEVTPLETPIVLEQLTSEQIEQLQQIGIELESFGEALWAARSAPAMLQQREDCAEALVELSLGGDLQTAQVATACRSAIRNGTPLSQAKMQSILNQWQQTRHPRTCPHGRPIYLALEESSLSRFFRRHWVIGKSHGI